MHAILQAVRDALAQAGTALSDRVHEGEAPRESTMPYAVLDLASNDEAAVMAGQVRPLRSTLSVSVYGSRDAGPKALRDAADAAYAALRDLAIGDASPALNLDVLGQSRGGRAVLDGETWRIDLAFVVTGTLPV
jgi:hypothetical protein